MNVLTYLIILFLALLVIVILPIVSGIGSYKYQRKTRQNDKKSDEISPHYQGYIPPDEAKRLEEESKKRKSTLSKIKNISISKGDIPVRFNLNDGSNNLKKRGKKVELANRDPSTFDFDIDELIEEEKAADIREEQVESQKRFAKDQGELEELA